MRFEPHDFVLNVLVRRTGLRLDQIRLDSRLVQDLQFDGDDAIDAILEIAKEFPMDVSEFDTSRYFRPEPTLLSVFRHLFSRPEDAIPKKTMTVGELIEGARQGRLPPS